MLCFFLVAVVLIFTSRTMREMVLWGTLHPNLIFVYFEPDARCLRVMASFRPGSKGSRYQVRCLVIRPRILSRM